MSSERYKLISYMLGDLSSMRYMCQNTFSTCYDMAINNKGFKEPIEGKEATIKIVIEKLVDLIG